MSDTLAMSHEDALDWINFGFRQASGITMLRGRLRAQEAANEALRAEIREIMREQREERVRIVSLLLDTAQHWSRIAAASRVEPGRVVVGKVVDRVCCELAKEVQAWTERPEPTEGALSEKPEPE